MNGKQLKNSILQWAIQGKLVPQDPNDEPASVLLERIREEKARLVKEKKIKKDKNESIIYRGEDNSYYEKFLATGEVKCIDEEIPFEIPSSWEWCRLGSIAEIIGGYAFPSHTLKGNQGTRVIRISDITENGFTNSRLVRYNGSPVSNIYRIQKFDILIAMTGGTVGKSFFVESMSEDMLLNQRVAIIRNRHICADYLNLVIKAPHIASVISERKNSTNDNISMVDIYDFFIPVPPIKNQKRIVATYYELLPLVNKYGHADHLTECLNNGIKDKLRKSILQEAIQGRLVPQIAEEGTVQELLEQIKQEKAWLVKGGKLKKSALQDSVIFRGDDNKYYEQVGNENIDITEEIPFDLPENWTWVRFGQYVRMSIGKTPPRGETKYWANGKYPWVSISDMSDYGLVTTTKESVSEYAKSLFGEISPVGTLIMSFKLTVGRTSLLNTSAYHNEAIISIYPFVDKNYQARNFLFHILPIISNLGDTKDAIKGKTLNSKSLNNLLLPLPPLNEQGRIVAMIELLFDKLK